MEKINIFVSEKIAQILENDARQFEIFKKDMRTVNMNRFLNLLIAGYYDAYTEQHQKMHEQIIRILQNHGMTDSDSLNQSASSMIKTVFSPELSKKKGIISRKISLKPTVLTEPILLYLNENLNDDTLSQYFCRMFQAYSQNPVNIRERIIFKDTFDLLQKLCGKHHTLSFTTTKEPDFVHEVLPYSISVGKEELYNYLLCQELNKETNTYETATYRLCRITKARQTKNTLHLIDDVKRHLDLMQQYGPQYTINDDEETCVRLTEKGEKLFHRIYFGRPTIDHIETRNHVSYYYFRCSKNQLSLYFRRFSGEHAVVLYPENLRKEITAFHQSSVNAYSTES